MSSADYWRKREAEALKENQKQEKDYDKQVAEIYQQMIDECDVDIKTFYARYASKEGITMAEAKKRADKLDIEEYGRKAKKYVKDKDFSDQANEEMRLYNMTMKVNRLELLKAELGLEMTAGSDELQKKLGVMLDDRARESYKRQAGILGKTVPDADTYGRMMDTIVNGSFHNATWSQRIWANQEALRSRVNALLVRGLIGGRNPREMARDLTRTVQSSQSNAERLMRTELARVQIGAQQQAIADAGYDEYTFLAIGTACGDCRALDEKTFKLKKMMPGENAPPMHPNCRCSVCAAMSDEEFRKLTGVDPIRTTDYNEFKEKAQNVPIQKIVDDFVNGKSTDRKILGERILKEYGVDGVPVNIKDMADYGYCSIRIQNGKLTVTDYNLNAGDKRGVPYQIKTAFHEAYHASGNGFSTDIDSMDQSRWLDLEETFAESSAHYMVSQYGITELAPSYPDKLVKMLPRLKKLPEFKGCKTIADFGKVAQEARQNGGGSVWKDMSQRAMRKRFDFATYTKQYFQSIREDVPGMVDKILENMPDSKQYRKDMIDDLTKAMDNVDTYGFPLDDNQSFMLNNAIAVEMGKMGVL